MTDAVIGVDVGTGSARAGVFDLQGRLLGAARHPIRIWHEAGGIVEQSSADIWSACCKAVAGALAASGRTAGSIRGIGFDATCSMVVLDADGASLPVGPSDDPQRDVIVWMDHRAIAETRAINAGGHDVLRYVGGTISPEMQTPKLLWLKTRRPGVFASAAHFFDLSDFLTFRATGSTDRSVCTVTCKWTYLAHEARWDDGYLAAIGLAELTGRGHARIGERVVAPGTPVGRGLTPRAAADFGLLPGTPVAASLIDAHAGAVGTLGGSGEGAAGRLAYIMGTSACIMASTPDPAFVPGVWGPYHSALVPGLWLNEGGQSAAGAAIDHLVRLHPACREASEAAAAAGLTLLEFLERRIAATGDFARAPLMARDIHILPDFLGNRSPHADPDARAILAGLDLDATVDGLAALYVAGLCGLGYATAEVAAALVKAGVACHTLVMSGGASRSALVRRIMADTTDLAVEIPETPEPVLLGAALLGAVAGGAHRDLPEAMASMTRSAETVHPTGGSIAAFHAAKREVFARLRAFDRQARRIMAEQDV